MAISTSEPAPRLDVRLVDRLLRDPEAVALVEGDRTLTAGEVHARAEAVARSLRELGVGTGDLVAVRMERSAESVIALLGVVFAGAAHVALDIGDPVARARYVLADCRPAVLLTHEDRHDQLADPDGPRTLLFEEAERASSRTAVGAVGAAPTGSPDDPVAAIYTSGSTGRPKASMISHRALARRLDSLQGTHPLGEDDRIVHHTAYGFDMFLIEVYWPLLNGCAVVLAEPGRRRDGGYLAELIREHSVTTLYCVVSLLEIFLAAQPPDRHFPTLRQVLTGGEPLSPALVRAFHERSPATLTNLYGPSECTVYCTAWQCPRDPALEKVLIGRAIEETSLWILDERGNPVPDGEPGELHIGGTGLALGYLNRPELTAERFLPDHLGDPDGRLYRSGDLVRTLPGGDLEFLGRLDDQVKVRGHRIEPGEVEAAARRSGLVRHVAVVVHRTADAARLVAFVVPREDGPEAPAELVRRLREALAAELPAVMVPAVVSVVDRLPLTENGKLDRRTLVERAAAQSPLTRAAEEPPADTLESTVAGLWATALGVPAVGRADDFFDLGGTSLKVIHVMRGLQEEFGVEPPVQLLFRQPTLRGFAALLREHLATTPASLVPGGSPGEGTASR
ncbi:non-ribosomal peptide synthetase [Streptomyces sp. JNUCC 64]